MTKEFGVRHGKNQKLKRKLQARLCVLVIITLTCFVLFLKLAFQGIPRNRLYCDWRY